MNILYEFRQMDAIYLNLLSVHLDMKMTSRLRRREYNLRDERARRSSMWSMSFARRIVM